MEGLRKQIDSFEKNSVYIVLDVIKDVSGVRVEKVRNQMTGQLFLRKTMTTRQELLRAEYEVLAGLDHPALPTVQDCFEVPGETVLIEELVEGQRLLQSGKLAWEQAVEIAIQLCDVVAYLHHQEPPIIHRDIKPDNIMCRSDGQIVLLDFGAARTFKEAGVCDTESLFKTFCKRSALRG